MYELVNVNFDVNLKLFLRLNCVSVGEKNVDNGDRLFGCVKLHKDRYQLLEEHLESWSLHAL